MEFMKHLHQVPFVDIPETLIKLGWEPIWIRCLVMLHLKKKFYEGRHQDIIFSLRNMRDILFPCVISENVQWEENKLWW